jgi:hypothetical protein
MMMILISFLIKKFFKIRSEYQMNLENLELIYQGKAKDYIKQTI